MGRGKKNQDQSQDYSDDQQQQKQQIRKPKIERIDKFKNLKKIVINLSMTQYPVVADVAQNLGWKIQYNNDAGDWDVYWTDFSIDAETLIKMHLFQKINYFPGICNIARKNLLGLNLMSLKNKLPDQYDFFPLTWMLPLQYAEFRAYFQSKPKGKTRTYIVKPQADCQGRGIFLTRKIQDLQNGKHYVVQRYIARPYLIDGLKFDLRIYVLLCGTNPMRIYMYNQGLGRLATEQYVQPNSSNLQKQYVHLTNYAINKNNPKFIFNNSSNNMGIGHKRSLTSIFKIFASKGINVDQLKQKINDITIKTITCALPLISHQYRCSQPQDYTGNICFHILGLDIMLNSKAEPILLQVNHTPSFATDTPLDHKIKFNLIKDTFNLMNINVKSKNELYNRAKDLNKQRLLTGKRQIYQGKQRQTVINQAQRLRDQYEDQHLGGYKRIFPINDQQKMKKYNHIINVAMKSYYQENGSIRMKMMEKQARKLVIQNYKQMKKNKDKASNDNNVDKNQKMQNSSPKLNQKKLKKITQLSTSTAIRIQNPSNSQIQQQSQLKQQQEDMNMSKSELYACEQSPSHTKLQNISINNIIDTKIRGMNQLCSVQILQRTYKDKNIDDINDQQLTAKTYNKSTHKYQQNINIQPQQIQLNSPHKNNSIKMRVKKTSSLKTNQQLPNILQKQISQSLKPNLNMLIRAHDKSNLKRPNKSQTKHSKNDNVISINEWRIRNAQINELKLRFIKKKYRQYSQFQRGQKRINLILSVQFSLMMRAYVRQLIIMIFHILIIIKYQLKLKLSYYILQKVISRTVLSIYQQMWTRQSYKNFKRYIDYFDPCHQIFKKIQAMPPIVSHHKINQLKQSIKKCQNHQNILLHTGDCAQPFQHVNHNTLEHKIGFFSRIKKLIQTKHKKQATIIGRIAGQYAKPRSSQFTIYNGKQIHNYKGDIVNSLDHQNRQPDANRLLQGYINSTITHNYIQNYMKDLYVSHEGLILPFQSSLTRQIDNKFYGLSGHMLWIGQRTRQLNGAHIQFFRGLNNPIGVKVSHKITKQQFVTLVKKLNPNNQQGKLLIIIRMGHKHLQQKLKQLIALKLQHNLNFLFISDPMHGNTMESTCKKYKVRHFNHIFNEIHSFQNIMKQYKLPVGLSLESSHEQVTQCIGGAYPFHQHQIQQKLYKSKCDPRLNQAQVKELINKMQF